MEIPWCVALSGWEGRLLRCSLHFLCEDLCFSRVTSWDLPSWWWSPISGYGNTVPDLSIITRYKGAAPAGKFCDVTDPIGVARHRLLALLNCHLTFLSPLYCPMLSSRWLCAINVCEFYILRNIRRPDNTTTTFRKKWSQKGASEEPFCKEPFFSKKRSHYHRGVRSRFGSSFFQSVMNHYSDIFSTVSCIWAKIRSRSAATPLWQQQTFRYLQYVIGEIIILQF